MQSRWAGPLITLAILSAVVAVIVFNLEPGGPKAPVTRPKAVGPTSAPSSAQIPAGFREYPIGEEVARSHMRIAAVWLPAVHMAGMDPAPAASDIIHLEADIRAAEDNPNGFAAGEFVPYLAVRYRIVPAGGGPAIEGPLLPMVARDGLHYGASVALPKAGDYRLSYHIEPPTASLGRHDDPVTGVAEWWEPFDVSFTWHYPGPPGAKKTP